MQRDVDFDTLWDYKLTTDGHSSFQSGSSDAMDFLSEGYIASEVPKVEFDGCTSKNRNFYMTITRTKNSTKPAVESFLSESPRLLQGPNPLIKFHDLELGFVSIQGGNSAKLLGALSFALIALLSVFAF